MDRAKQGTHPARNNVHANEKFIALAGTGDSHSCCFLAAGDAEYPSPLGRLRVSWKSRGGDAGERGSRGTEVSEDESAAAVTDFPLPVLSARPPAVSARLRAPPHARVGEAFSIW